jgi:hypothetical protein
MTTTIQKEKKNIKSHLKHSMFAKSKLLVLSVKKDSCLFFHVLSTHLPVFINVSVTQRYINPLYYYNTYYSEKRKGKKAFYFKQ